MSAIAVFKENPLIAKPNAVAAAGGCSVSITTIIKIANPTAREYESAAYKTAECGIKEHKEPMMRPVVCPPITFLGLAVAIPGIAKIIKAVAPIDAMITAFLRLRANRTIKTTQVAKRHWNT